MNQSLDLDTSNFNKFLQLFQLFTTGDHCAVEVEVSRSSNFAPLHRFDFRQPERTLLLRHHYQSMDFS